jgi:hypothetical protein
MKDVNGGQRHRRKEDTGGSMMSPKLFVYKFSTSILLFRLFALCARCQIYPCCSVRLDTQSELLF